MARGEINDRHQHEQAAGHGEENEFHRRVDAPRTAPHADQKIHRHQHDFPEHIEQHQIERQEGAEHAGFQEQHEDQILFDLVTHRPGGQQRQRHEKGGKQNQKNADAVDTDKILNADGRHPRHPLDQLHLAVAAVEAFENLERPEKGYRAGDQCNGEQPGRLAPRQKQKRRRADHRDGE